MNLLDTLATFLGWCTVINVGLIIFIAIVIGLFHEGIGNLVARLFGVEQMQAKIALLRIYMHYRVLFLVFNLVPYVALRIMLH